MFVPGIFLNHALGLPANMVLKRNELLTNVLYFPNELIHTGFHSYTGNTTGVVGSEEGYKDLREKWTKG